MNKRCQCCEKLLDNIMCGRKYCPACSYIINRFRHKIASLKYEIRKLKVKLYGVEDRRYVNLRLHRTKKAKKEKIFK